MDTKIDSSRAIHVPVAGRLSKPIAFVKGHVKTLVVIVVLLLGGAAGYLWWSRKDSAADYVTDKVTRGSIEVAVNATGTVQAVTTVQVGSQVSGAVAWLGADFKSHVTRGQIIAKLDPALFQAQVDTARANLANAQAGVQGALTEINNQKANIEAAKANDAATKASRDDAIAIAKQNEKLRGIIPDRDIQASEAAAQVAIARYNQATSQIGQAQAQLQIAQSKLKQAQAAVQQAQAQLQSANVNLQHSIIESPIDGVVVSRNVDVGQTVAASLQAPTLFTIANDLTNMQVLASIDEADVGQVREGGKANFAVDAFPGQRFTGDITQVRLNAQTLQNVVTYTAVITVSNPDQKLMPGMTANITIPVARRDDVLRVPNAALRFKPDLTEQQQKDLQAKIDAFTQQQQQQGGSEAEPKQGQAQPQGGQQQREKPSPGEGHKPGEKPKGDNQGKPAGAPGGAGSGKQRHQQQAEGDAQVEQPAGEQQQQGGRKGGKRPNDNQSAASAGHGGAQAGAGKGRQQGQQAQAGSEGNRPQRKNAGNQQADQKQQPAQGQGASQPAAGGRGGSGRQRQIQVVWVLTANKTLESHIIRTGITDGRLTEVVSGDLKEGDVVVTGQTGGATSNNNRNAQPTTPFGQRPPGAGGPPRGGR